MELRDVLEALAPPGPAWASDPGWLRAAGLVYS